MSSPMDEPLDPLHKLADLAKLEARLAEPFADEHAILSASGIDGDPDQPVIVGRVHNGLNAPPVLPEAEKTVSAWRTRSSPGGAGFNEIRLDDLAGEERFAQRDLNAVVERDTNIEVKRHTTLRVAGNQDAHIKGHGTVGFEQSFSVNAQTVDIKGRDHVKLDTNHKIFDANSRHDTVDANDTVRTGNTFHHVDGVFKVTGSAFTSTRTKSS